MKIKEKLTKENMKKVAKGAAIGAAGVAIGMIGFKAGRKSMASEVVDFMVDERMDSESIGKKYMDEYDVESLDELPEVLKLEATMAIEKDGAIDSYKRHLEKEIKDMI